MSTLEDFTCLDESERLEHQVHQAIEHSPYLSRKGVRCETRDGRVTLHGEVGTYFQKQMATEAVRKLDGIEKIENCLQVVWR